MMRNQVVGVMGSGSTDEEHLAGPLGTLLARAGVNMLTGGGGGVMTSSSKAFHTTPNRKGLVIGVLPGIAGDQSWTEARESASSCITAVPRPPDGYPNEYVEIAIFTHLSSSGSFGTEGTSRNHINVLSSDIIVALPGGPGTLSELKLAQRYGKPSAVYLGRNGSVAQLSTEEELGSPVFRELEGIRLWLATHGIIEGGA